MDDPPVRGLGDVLTTSGRKTFLIFYEKVSQDITRYCSGRSEILLQVHTPTSLRSILIRNYYVGFHPFLGHSILSVNRGIALLFIGPSALDGVGVSPTPRPPVPPGKTRYPLYRRLSGP